MKRSIPCLLAMALTCLAADDKKDSEALAKSLYESASKVVTLFEGIKNKADAEKAKQEIVKLFENMQNVEKEFRALGDPDKDKLEEKWKPRFEELKTRFKKEADRLRKDEEIYKVLADVGPFKALAEAKLNAARIQMQQIEQALKAFYINNGDYPKSLDELGKGDKPFIVASTLKDPWGNAYKYDAAGKNNKGLQPDVWTVDPNGKTIGNWMDRPAPPKDK